MQDSSVMPASAVRHAPLRVAIVLFFVVLALSLVGGAHWYIAQRLVLDPGLDGAARTAALAAIVTLGVGAILTPGLERWLAPPLLRVVSFPFPNPCSVRYPSISRTVFS